MKIDTKKLAYQLQAHQYYIGLDEKSKRKVLKSIKDYYETSNIRINMYMDERDFQRFICDNLGDDTIIQCVTGF